MNILIADDNTTSLKLLRATLEAEGHRVFLAADGVEALAILEQEKVDAIISDILMPRMDGYRLCLEVRKSEKFKSLPFIFYTATYTSSSDSKTALDLGGDKFLKKSAPASELIQALQEATSMPRQARPVTAAPEELGLMKEYSAWLVAKLETDVTERKSADEALGESEERYRELFENANDLIQIVSPSGRVLFANRAWRETLGYSDDNLPGLRLPALVHPDRRKDWQKLIERALAGEQLKLVETEFLSKEGARIALEGSIGARFLKSQVTSLRCIFRDVTDKKKLEAQMLRNQRMESLGELAGGIAHDLNNILTPILMSLQILKIRFPDAESASILDILAASAKRGAEMVKQVLTFSRGVEGTRIEVQLQHIIEELRTIISQTFPKDIRFRAEVPKGLWAVRGDATQIHQVLLNLCVNARDGMPRGGALTITAENVSLDESFARLNSEAKVGPHIVVSVADTGTGMPAEVRERIFEPFFTTKPIGEGTGLGLPNVRAIVKSHGGFISVYSEVGKGSVFKVCLPATLSDSDARAQQAKPAIPPGKGELILVVDDEASVRSIAQQTLEMYGYRVLTAGDGAQAVALCAQRPGEISLMLIDIMMPIMDGPTAIRAIRKLGHQIKIITTTGLPSETEGADTQDSQANAVLHKPYTAEKLLKTIRELLDDAPGAKPPAPQQ